MNALAPPKGYASWLDYAAATMETRDLFNEQVNSDESYWGRIVQRDEMHQAANAEISSLREESAEVQLALRLAGTDLEGKIQSQVELAQQVVGEVERLRARVAELEKASHERSQSWDTDIEELVRTVARAEKAEAEAKLAMRLQGEMEDKWRQEQKRAGEAEVRVAELATRKTHPRGSGQAKMKCGSDGQLVKDGEEDLTIEQARALYINAGGPREHSLDEWTDIHKEMVQILKAKTDQEGGRIIQWWDCWDRNHSATKFAQKIRSDYLLRKKAALAGVGEKKK